MNVSVILPALTPTNDFFRCLYSIRSALSNETEYEIICVVRDLNLFNEFQGSDVTFHQEEVPSIYGAMNKGVSLASGRYLYFIGQDDVLLPAAAEAINEGIELGADLILADVFWGKSGIFKNFLSRSSLVWRNWCHQGIVYDRVKFINSVAEYPVNYKLQSDHYANIIFSSMPNLKVIKHNGCIAWYATGGFSSSADDHEFRAAFPSLILKHFGFIYYYLVIVRREILSIVRFIKK